MKLTQEQQQKYLDLLFKLLRLPSISALPENKTDIDETVEWLKSFIAKIGFEKEKIETLFAEGDSSANAHPIIYAEKISDKASPTVLIYGHYDVQPVDPIDLWTSEPFNPTIRNEQIYARGSSDDKGQLFTHLAALDMLSSQWGDVWPINVKLLLEGEEEVGSSSLTKLLKEPKTKEKLKAEVCLVSDSAFVDKAHPTITYGLRGITYFQLDVKLVLHIKSSASYFGILSFHAANLLLALLIKYR